MRFVDFAAPAAAIASVLAVNVAHAQAPAPPAAAPTQPGPAPAPPAAAQPTAPVPVETAPAGSPPEAAPVAPQQEPTIYVAQPPLPPLYPRTRLRHDGFYLRLSGGLGYGATTSKTDSSGSEHSVQGLTSGLDVLIGGTPGPGLVIGGGLFLSGYLAADSSSEGPALAGLTKGGEKSGLAMIGPIIDIFPNPYGGLHFGGTVALAGSTLKSHDDKGSVGAGLALWLGYMGWVSSEWSAGGLLKFTGAWTGREVNDDAGNRVDVSDTNAGVQLMFSAAYH